MPDQAIITQDQIDPRAIRVPPEQLAQAIPVDQGAPAIGMQPQNPNMAIPTQAAKPELVNHQGKAIDTGRIAGIPGKLNPTTDGSPGSYNPIDPRTSAIASLWHKADNIHNPVLRVAGKIGSGILRGIDAVGNIAAPNIMRGIPGTSANQALGIRNQENEQARQSKTALEQAQTQEATARAGEATASAGEKTAQTEAEKHPAVKIEYDQGIPVAVSRGKYESYPIGGPTMPSDLQGFAEAAITAHKQRLSEQASAAKPDTATQNKEKFQHAVGVLRGEGLLAPGDVTDFKKISNALSQSQQLGEDDKNALTGYMAANPTPATSVAVHVAERPAPARSANDALNGLDPKLQGKVLDDVTKAGDSYIEAAQAADDIKTFVDDAKKGNKLAYSYLPTEGVLTFNTGRGVKRVNMPEIQSYAGAGSAMDRIRGFFGKAASGASIPDDVLNDMEGLHQQVSGNARRAYERKLTVVNGTYGTGFKPLELGANGEQGGGAPATGAIVKGYKFKGGDPSDKNNWEKQ